MAVMEDVIGFLKDTPPFSFLDEGALRGIAQGIAMEYYPKGTLILRQDGPPSKHLMVIKKGGVKIYVTSGQQEVAIDYRSEGDSFGFLSLIGADRSRANVIAIEDTICYLIDRKTVIGLLDASSAFTEYFLKSFLNSFIDRTYMEMRTRSGLIEGGERLLFTTPVLEIASKEVVTAPETVSIKEAAEIMSQKRISSLVLLSADGAPVGIVTDRDLRDKVVARGKSTEGAVSSIMSVPLIKAEGREYCFEALLKMLRYNIHHLLIVDGGRLAGILTNHDLMMLQGTSPVSLVRAIESAQTVDDLVSIAPETTKIIRLLFKEGARASNITHIITEINDRLVRKVLELTEKEIGSPPVEFCWVVFGSEGRREQTFRTDQDNAIIYKDPSGATESEAAQKYFATFSQRAGEGLVRCGFPPCPAGYMAVNPLWRQPLKVWKRYFTDWLSNPISDSVLKTLIFFDFRPVYGEPELAERLREHLLSALKKHEIFFGFMANQIVKNTPPIGFWKTFVVEKSGEHKDELNLKVKGLSPLVDIVRLLALERGIKETSTIERIHALRALHLDRGEDEEELERAFEFLMLLRIHHQLSQIESGKQPDNFINPNRLSNLEKKTLKEVFGFIAKMQGLIVERYRQMIL